MRDILFKAKVKTTKQWVEGFYCQLPKVSLGATIIANGELCAEDVADYIIVNKFKQHRNFSNSHPLEVVECEYYEIDPKTLCSFIGINDINGQKIWENDIVRDMQTFMVQKSYGISENELNLYRKAGKMGIVRFSTEDVGSCGGCYPQFEGNGFKAKEVNLNCCEVIGNIFELSEFVEREKVC